MELWIPIIAIIGAFGAPVLIICIVYYFSGRKQKMFHETLQELIKAGQEVSPEMLANMPGHGGKQQAHKNDIRTGTITLSVGIGIALFGAIGVGEEVILGAGLLVGSIGLGLLLYGYYQIKVQLADDVG
jgi:hypothetical protein